MGAQLKPSLYNVMVPAGESHPGASILYNARTGALALASKDLEQLLDNPELHEAGFAVLAEEDEFAEIESAYRHAQQDESVLALCIAPTYACNLACPYCYEEGRDAPAKPMPREVQDRIAAFAKSEYEHAPYERLEIQWYGGEPMLHPDVVATISEQLMAFCEDRGIGLSANMVSNASRITAEDAAMLNRSNVLDVLVTVDGTEELHNERRPMRDGGNSYEAVLAGIENLVSAGVHVSVLMNTDKVNDSALDELNEVLEQRFGIQAKRAKLNDYHGSFGSGSFREPRFSLMDHKEFTREQCRRFSEEGHSPQEFAALMGPISTFCRGQWERYYCIDAMGDVYKCDGRLGRTEYRIFTLDEVADGKKASPGTAPAYPFNDEACVSCVLLPLCKGTCEWERKCCTDHPCHPLKYTMDGYLRAWLASFGDVETGDSGFMLLWPGQKS